MNDWGGRVRPRDLRPADEWGVPPNFWLISDTHFGHGNIYGYTGRPADAHERIVANWRALVTDEDIVVHLGDLALMRPDRMASLLAELPGRILLLRGNHDRQKPEVYERLGIATIPPFTLSRGGWTVAFTHAPHPELVTTPRRQWLNVHGHIHEKLAPDLRLINVGVEWTGYSPVRVDELLDERIAALQRAPATFQPPLPYEEWLAREYGGEVQRSDVERFPDERARTLARETYERYRHDALKAALTTEMGCMEARDDAGCEGGKPRTVDEG